jgi:hypothetical protein
LLRPYFEKYHADLFIRRKPVAATDTNAEGSLARRKFAVSHITTTSSSKNGNTLVEKPSVPFEDVDENEKASGFIENTIFEGEMTKFDKKPNPMLNVNALASLNNRSMFVNSHFVK